MIQLGWRSAVLWMGIKDVSIYRLEFLLRLLGGSLIPILIQLIFWSAIFSDGTNQTIAGTNFLGLVQYTLATLLFTQVRGGDYEFELVEMIRTGTLSAHLLKPYSVIQFNYLQSLGEKLPIILFSLLVGLIVSIFTDISAWRLIAAMGLALLGNIVHYLLGATLSAAAFKWEDAWGLLMLKNQVTAVLCGELFPLFLLPASVFAFVKYSPFSIYVYAPTQFALGKLSGDEFVQYLWVGVAWLFIFAMCCAFAWKRGIHHYQSLGN